jgi:cytochrome c peroxidase
MITHIKFPMTQVAAVFCLLGLLQTMHGSVEGEDNACPPTPKSYVCVEGRSYPDIGPLDPPTSPPNLREEGMVRLATGNPREEEMVESAPGNPKQEAIVNLGRQLFHDTLLAKKDPQKGHLHACTYCHRGEHGFADHRGRSAGMDGRGVRNAPTIFNVFANDHVFFWDGRASSLEEQVERVVLGGGEMGEQTAQDVEKRLNETEDWEGIESYPKQFKKVFGLRRAEVKFDLIKKAVAAYERTIFSGNAPFDRYVRQTEPRPFIDGFGPDELEGMKLFKTEARCILCHNGANFTDYKFHNIGVPLPSEGLPKDFKKFGDYCKDGEDRGRFCQTGNPTEDGAYKTPTLRCSEKTPYYAHNGAISSLEEVVKLHDKNGPDPLLKKVDWSEDKSKVEKLMKFLIALNGKDESGQVCIDTRPGPRFPRHKDR